MTGFELFRYSVRRVVNNFNEALAVSGLIWIGMIAIQIISAEIVSNNLIGEGAAAQVPLSIALLVMLASLSVALASCWIAVAWHRFVLSGERPVSVLPQWQGGPIWAYAINTIKIGILVILFGAVASGVMSMVLGSAVQSVGVIVIAALVGLPAIYGFYRVSPILPAAALGEPLGLGAAWAMTSKISGAIFQAAILGLMGILLLQVPAVVLGDGIIGLLYELAAGWVILMVGVSLLSSIYEAVSAGEM